MHVSYHIAMVNAPQAIGVCILLIDKENVLLGKRKNSYKAGFYGLPGGRVEVGEKLSETASRELLEETGVIGKDLRYIGFVKERQEDRDFIHFVFTCFDFDGEVRCMEPDKCEGWGWLPMREHGVSILPGHAEAMRLFFDNQPYSELFKE